MSEGKQKKVTGFWSTLLGILTAVAAIITAIGGLITVLYATGILGPGEPPTRIPSAVESRPAEVAEKIPSLVVPKDGSTVSQPYIQPWGYSDGTNQVLLSMFASTI